jgi:hypothetical protein
MAISGWSKKKTKNAVRGIALFFFLFALATAFTTNAQNANRQIALKGHYFLVVWVYQGPDDDLVHAHTFTSFYRGDDLAKGVVRPATISWLPATGVVQPFGAEKGHNFSLDETLHLACRSGRQVTSWGPYEIIEPGRHRLASGLAEAERRADRMLAARSLLGPAAGS